MRDLDALVAAALADGPKFGPAPGTVYLETLEEGDRFTSGGRPGTLQRLGASGAVVQWDGRETVEVAGRTFQRPLAPVTIALRCEVVRLLKPLPDTL